MTEKGYNIHEIVAQVRSAGNPRQTAMEAVADTVGLEDAELLQALGVKAWGELPTTPYPDAPGRADKPAAQPRKKPGPKAQASTTKTPSASGTLRDALGRALGGLEEFASVWEGVLTDPHGPFSAAQVEALAQIDEAASIFLSGWDAAALILMGGNEHE